MKKAGVHFLSKLLQKCEIGGSDPDQGGINTRPYLQHNLIKKGWNHDSSCLARMKSRVLNHWDKNIVSKYPTCFMKPQLLHASTDLLRIKITEISLLL
jgi:hypothetical protein